MTCILERSANAGAAEPVSAAVLPPALSVPSVPSGPTVPRIKATHRRGLHRAITGLTLMMLAVEVVLIAPQLGAMAAALTSPRWGWLLLAVGSEVGSIVLFALLQQRMLRVGGVRVPLRRMTSLAFAANALSATLPAGSALSAGYTFHRLRRFGASSALATWSLLCAGVLSMIAFSALVIAASVLAGASGTSALAVAAGLVGSLAVLTALALLLHRPQLLARIATGPLGWANRLGRRDPTAGVAWVRRTAAQTALIRPTSRDWLVGLLFAALNWVADLVCLVLSCYAVGLTGLNLQLALVAYVAGMAASSISLLPGGLGGVDAALVLTLVHGGIGAPIAAAGVLIYRLVSFVLIAAVGWLVWALIRDRVRQAAARPNAVPVAGPAAPVLAAPPALTAV
jgi:putative heme transporter